jgi:SAM-dependent methyltransferase
MSEPAPWYETFFGRDYLDVYSHQLTEERAEKEAAFAREALGLEPGQALLDLCCGPGRHSLPMALHGLHVTSFDLSRQYLAMVGAAARAQKVAVETVRGDMRALPFRERFDAVINMFSSFGYLESEADDARVLDGVARALKPGGRLLMDLLNREWVMANHAPHDWHLSDDGTIYLEHRDVDLIHSRNHVSFTAIGPDGSRREIEGHHFRLYTLTEVIALLGTAGLAFERAYGGFEGEPYAIATRRMIVVATKIRSDVA